MITSPKPTGKELWKAFVDAIWALLMPVIILGGIYGGYFTPTEAAAVAVVYGLIIGLFVYRELKWKDIYLHSVIIIAQHSSMEWVDKVLAHSS